MLGLAAGRRMRQNISPDPYGIESWDVENEACLRVHMGNIFTWPVSPAKGEAPPDTPVNAEPTRAGYPGLRSTISPRAAWTPHLL